ncbi:MerR family transcriptional regulator [Streptomyces spiralis]
MHLRNAWRDLMEALGTDAVNASRMAGRGSWREGSRRRSDQVPEHVSLSYPASSTPARADDLVEQPDCPSDESLSSLPATERLAGLRTGTTKELPPAQIPRNVTVINTEIEESPELEAGSAPETVGYRGPIACAAAGITYRQLDYWVRTGLVEPSVRSGHGSRWLYSFKDVVLLRITKRLADSGVSVYITREAVRHLRSRRDADLAGLTLLSDGATIHECSTPDEVLALIHGQGKFGIAVEVVVREVMHALAKLNSRPLGLDSPLTDLSELDELADAATA